MLRFELHQIVLSVQRCFLPLPKLSPSQLELLSAHLRARGFKVSEGSAAGRRSASKGGQRISIDAALGLASSRGDLLDALGPAIPGILAARPGVARKNVAELYFAVKRSATLTELQFFPRLESLRTWSVLRRDGLCGLTPDEASVLHQVLSSAPKSARIQCVTAKPRPGSTALQVGRNIYFSSTVPIPEFLSSLRTIDSGRAESASYLPRDSVFRVPRARLDTRLDSEELGEWCSVD